MAQTCPKPIDERRPRRSGFNSALAVVIAGAITASCSSSTDTLTSLGLSSGALQDSASAGTDTADKPEEKRTKTDSASASTASDRESHNAGDKTKTSLFSPRSERPVDDPEGSDVDEPRANFFASLFSAKNSNSASQNERGENRAGSAAKPQKNGSGKAERAGDPDGEKPLAAERARRNTDSDKDKEDAVERRSLLSAFFAPAGQEENKPADAEKEKVQQVAARPSGETNKNAQSRLSGVPLPGVRNKDALFEIKRGAGADDDSNIDLYEQSGDYQVASASGLARLAPHGLLKQREGVDVSCLKPKLVRTLKTIERHFGKSVIVTSGYRSPAHNKRVRGARNSLHMSCSAADIQMKGVGKWTLARFVRSLPGRGGVGTYCHTRSVHVDVGPERDWNWSC